MAGENGEMESGCRGRGREEGTGRGRGCAHRVSVGQGKVIGLSDKVEESERVEGVAELQGGGQCGSHLASRLESATVRVRVRVRIVRLRVVKVQVRVVAVEGT